MKEAGYDENGIIWNDDWDEEAQEFVDQQEEIQMSTIRTEQHKVGV